VQCTHVLLVDRLHHIHNGARSDDNHVQLKHQHRAMTQSNAPFQIHGATYAPLTTAVSDALVSNVVVAMAHETLRTLGLAFRDFPGGIDELPPGWDTAEDASSLIEGGLTLYGILGIKDPLRKVCIRVLSL
jgi:magnesium-transporting ATPase (P-type)